MSGNAPNIYHSGIKCVLFRFCYCEVLVQIDVQLCKSHQKSVNLIILIRATSKGYSSSTYWMQNTRTKDLISRFWTQLSWDCSIAYKTTVLEMIKCILCNNDEPAGSQKVLLSIVFGPTVFLRIKQFTISVQDTQGKKKREHWMFSLPWARACCISAEFLHVKPGKGAAFVRSKLKNCLSGSIQDKTFRAGEPLQPASIERKDAQFSYLDGDDVSSLHKIASSESTSKFSNFWS